MIGYVTIAGVAACVLTALLMRAAAIKRARVRLAAARKAASATVRGARLEATAARRAAETRAREESLELRARADTEFGIAVEEIARREERVVNLESEFADELVVLEQSAAGLEERQQAVTSLRDRAQGLQRDAQRRREQAHEALESRAGDTADNLQQAMIARWIEEVRAEAAQSVRLVEQHAADPCHDREAKRLMEIAVSRYQNHFLTERNISNIRVTPDVCELLLADGGAIHEVMQEIANVQLHVNPAEESVRLEGMDGVGREIARRALSRLAKKTSTKSAARSDPRGWITKLRDGLEREIQGLGRKAFSVLKIPKPHQDIVRLVGALNYRTSYTQNQWLHAVEAAFLAGMMASEMGLDIKLARRATLMHDIGKALTHQIDGSHAVIGADIARKLGEDEIVANAIGAHHADEPPNSVYAYLVAAADAMSGARPGARREATEGFSNRVEDLERIGTSYRGVDRAHAVHGGRELRIYVDEAQVNDLRVIELSQNIAEQIADELTFPGQIKITVIRSYEAVSVAG